MEVLSYVLINISTLMFSFLSVFFLRYQKQYVRKNEIIDVSDKKENKTDCDAEDEKLDMKKAEKEEIEETVSEAISDFFVEEGKKETVPVIGVKFKTLLSNHVSFIFSMCIVNLALANALISIYDNHIITDIKSMLIVTALWPIALIDFREKIIPNAILKILLLLRLVLIIPELILLDNQFKIVLSSVVAAFAIFLASVAVGLIMKGSIGMGDVKLFIVLGLYLGLEGIWSAIFCSLIVSFFISIYLLCTKKVGRKDSIPFAPAIMLGTFLSVFITGI